MIQLYVRPRFYLDIAEEVENLSRRAGTEVAERWCTALEETIQDLLRHPCLGRERKDLHQPGIRSWRVNHFRRWLIFYSTRESALVLLRVRYGMTDLFALGFDVQR